MGNCCKLVGNLAVDDYVVSVQVRSDTEVSQVGSNLVVGATIGSVSISGYASRQLHEACPGRAGVTINWLRKYDCDRNEVHFIFMGAGKSYISGDVGGLASVINEVVKYPVLNASAASGPTAFYEQTYQSDGYGLSYSGRPYPFYTDKDNGVEIDIGGGIVGSNKLYLQSFNLQCTPGQVPMANYNLLFTINP